MQTMLRAAFSTAMLATGLLAASSSAQACNDESYIGTMCVFAFDWCTRGFIPADGRTVEVNRYQGLFALYGFRYGGDNRTTFGIPDLRGRVAVGVGAGPGLPQAVALGQQFGQQSLTLTPAQTPLVPHTHVSTFTPVTASKPVTVPASGSGATLGVNTTPVTSTSPVTPSVANGNTVYLANAVNYSGPTNTLRGLYTSTPPGNGTTATMRVTVTGHPQLDFNVDTVTGGTVGIAPASANATAAVPTQPPSLGVTVCIVATGLYPNRP